MKYLESRNLEVRLLLTVEDKWEDTVLRCCVQCNTKCFLLYLFIYYV